MTRILVVGAHPDDEVLGCGGTLARHVEAGDVVSALLLADGETSRGAGDIPRRRRSALAAASALGLESVTTLDYPDNRLDSVALLDVVQSIERVIAEKRPEIVYTHHAGDLNIDHAIVHRAVLTACRPAPVGGVRAIYAFEVPSSTEWGATTLAPFVPTRYVDVTATLATKRRALECYGEEMRAAPHPRSLAGIEALASLRGHQIGCAAAEAFIVIREVVR
jgi:LmbE family N-acetylglucosaminyl deacetylase